VSKGSTGLAAAVADQIDRLMKAHKIRGAALAKATGMTQRSMSRKLNKLSDFGVNEIHRIAEHFGFDPEDIIAWARRTLPPSE
jgi:transcriptional regulator with XRE-family HTH domain